MARARGDAILFPQATGREIAGERRPAVAEQRPKSTAYEESSPPRGDEFAPDPPPAALALHAQSLSAHHHTLDELLSLVRSYLEPTPADVAAIERAYHCAADAHAGQQRESGEPYVNH